MVLCCFFASISLEDRAICSGSGMAFGQFTVAKARIGFK